MKSTFTFTDNTKATLEQVAQFKDTMVMLMAAGIEARMKTGGKVPFLPHSTKWAQRGALRTSIRSVKLGIGRYAVTAGADGPAAAYAAAQEAGMTHGHRMTNYSTPGTGPHWFQEAIDYTKGRTAQYADAAKRAAGIGEM